MGLCVREEGGKSHRVFREGCESAAEVGNSLRGGGAGMGEGLVALEMRRLYV